MKLLNKIKSHLRDNSGDTNLQMVILIAIAFVVGAIIIAAIFAIINANFEPGMTHKIKSWLD